MLKIRVFLVFTFLILNGVAISQEKNDVIQARIEFISEQLESESIDLTDVVANLNYFYDTPLNINGATKEEMQSIGLLTDIQINDALLHIDIFGKFISVYELQELPYWDLETIRLVLPFIKVDDKLEQLHVDFKEVLKYGKFEAFLRYQSNLENKSGYDQVSDSVLNNSNSYYYGNPDRYYTRLRYSYRTNLSVGVTAEKDPGEEFFKGSQSNGFDFYSAHAFYKGGKYLRAVALGDYQVQIGQGLNLWSGYAFGKTADVTNVKKSALSLKPYTSVDETRFMRGGAFEVGYGKFALTSFASYKGVDGAIISDSLVDEQAFVTSINLTGFHRTNSEIARKNTLHEIIGGSNLRFENRNLQLGIAAVYQGYETAYNKDTLPYSQFDFRGKGTVGLSADYSWVFRNFNFFGELSRSSFSGGLAFMNGVLFSLDSRASIAIIYRNYQKDYHTFYNAGFSEGSKTQNEQGLYAGLKVNVSRAFTVNTYADMFTFPWLKYQVDAPSIGHEFMIQPTYKPNREMEVYVRYREQLRQKNSRFSDGTITEIEDVLQRNYRLNFSLKVSEGLKIKSRIEYVTIDRLSSGNESGLIITQDVVFQPKSFPLDLALRYALFDTDSYDTRIYTFESNALYVFSVPAYYYEGSRAYVMARYSFLKHFDLWVKYGVSIFANRKSIGSGAEEILGNTKTDLTVQLRITF